MIGCDSLDSMWWSVLCALTRAPVSDTRDGAASEIIAFCGSYPAERAWVWNPRRRASAVYGVAELLWYLRASADGREMAYYAPQYTRFLREDGIAEGAYGPRLRGLHGLRQIATQLLTDPGTRRAFLPVWRAIDLDRSVIGDCKDVPCTIGLQFLLRDGALDCVVTMRSNDAWLGLPYDGWCFSMMCCMVAGMLGVRPGVMHHHVGSMHLYSRNHAAAVEAKSLGPTRSRPDRPSPTSVKLGPLDARISELDLLQKAERELRRGNTLEPAASEIKCPALREWLGLLVEYAQGWPSPLLEDRRLSRLAEEA